METEGGSGTRRQAGDSAVSVNDTDSSKLSTSSSSSEQGPPTRSEAERRNKRKEDKQRRREAKREQQRLEEKERRKEERRRKREERAKRREARKKKEKVKPVHISSSELSSSSDDGDDDESYIKTRKGKRDADSSNTKKKYSAVSFNYSSMSNRDRKSFINVPAGKLPKFDGTNFAKWKHLMKAYLVGLHPGIWEIVCSGVEPPMDPEGPTHEELAAIHLNGQATSVLLSALEGDEYNRVMGVEVAKQIWGPFLFCIPQKLVYLHGRNNRLTTQCMHTKEFEHLTHL